MNAIDVAAVRVLNVLAGHELTAANKPNVALLSFFSHWNLTVSR
jgi:hypothetical protein